MTHGLPSCHFWIHSGEWQLESTAIDKSRGLQTDGETLAYFYYDFRNSRRMMAEEPLCSLTVQLLRKAKKDWLPLFSDLVDRKEQGGGPPANPVILTNLMQRAAGLYDQPTVIIDALDECDDLSELAIFHLLDPGAKFYLVSCPSRVRATPDIDDCPVTGLIAGGTCQRGSTNKSVRSPALRCGLTVQSIFILERNVTTYEIASLVMYPSYRIPRRPLKLKKPTAEQRECLQTEKGHGTGASS
ncbi:hypothetical protein BDN67DRAFT_1017303 [Paxillus ammoniavirescens]|nr:hypothetical protein BDN67DRAFT_1017303 [Paxillus ammoniavirescens]